MIRHLVVAVLASGLIATGAAGGPREKRVAYSDSELRDADSRRAFYHRIGLAVEEVCGAYVTVEFYQWPEMDECYAKAWKSVDTQLAARSPDRTIRLAMR